MSNPVSGPDHSPAPERLLFREAADLAIRLQNDPANPVAVEMVRSWIARGPDHQAAWARVAAIHGMTGKVLNEQRNGAPLISRRTFALAGLLGLGGAAGAWVIPDLILRARADHITASAEQRQIGLPDGSIVTLGPDSAIAVQMTASGRRIDLLQGMAFFDVAPDTARPFSVVADQVAVTALGTAFDVSLDAGFVQVSVDHGQVAVQARQGDSPDLLAAGDWVTMAPENITPNRGQRDPEQIASWRSGMLIAENEAVSALVARIARWQDGHVVLADPWLGSRAVSGVFDLNDPFSALEAVVRPFGAKVRKVTPFLIVISPV
ncbi:DUF4880 domain-containing protein [Xinfangfangia sp. D13-10-4-6]|uniref:FecR family protein n=1 Tax=Pseudogemmobacter hezensis TaxID=2737662 RepID=UPI001554251A|nr:FecR domain-containing protein [Pseudogemmobacter hezensis]NPD17029.1 DUF4880 domain-containing protein [Pseudogemmobacter hezensis]